MPAKREGDCHRVIEGAEDDCIEVVESPEEIMDMIEERQVRRVGGPGI